MLKLMVLSPIDHQRLPKYAVLLAQTWMEPLFKKSLNGAPKFTEGITKIKRQCQSKSLIQVVEKCLRLLKHNLGSNYFNNQKKTIGKRV